MVEQNAACVQQAMSHPSAAVRCAGLAALGALSDQVYSGVTERDASLIWTWLLRSSQEPSTAAVRAAAAKAAGCLTRLQRARDIPGGPLQPLGSLTFRSLKRDCMDNLVEFMILLDAASLT
jgi:hypothetical protein